MDSLKAKNGFMKISVNILDNELLDAIRFTGARTKREAIVTAIADFNRRRRMAELVRHAGTCENLVSGEDLRRLRHRD